MRISFAIRITVAADRPIMLATTGLGIPASSKCVTAVWRRSWNRHLREGGFLSSTPGSRFCVPPFLDWTSIARGGSFQRFPLGAALLLVALLSPMLLSSRHWTFGIGFVARDGTGEAEVVLLAAGATLF